jgi:hypothetical protein
MTNDGPDGASPEVIEDGDWLYRRLALNHLRSDGTVNRTAFMRNSVPPNRGKEPDPHIVGSPLRRATNGAGQS